MSGGSLKSGRIVRGAIFPEPVRVITTIPVGESVKLVGIGLESSQAYEPILTPAQNAELEVSPEMRPFDGGGGAVRFQPPVPDATSVSKAFHPDVAAVVGGCHGMDPVDLAGSSFRVGHAGWSWIAIPSGHARRLTHTRESRLIACRSGGLLVLATGTRSRRCGSTQTTDLRRRLATGGSGNGGK